MLVDREERVPESEKRQEVLTRMNEQRLEALMYGAFREDDLGYRDDHLCSIFP